MEDSAPLQQSKPQITRQIRRSIRGAQQASQGQEIPGVKRCGSTLECIPEPQLHMGPVDSPVADGITRNEG